MTHVYRNFNAHVSGSGAKRQRPSRADALPPLPEPPGLQSRSGLSPPLLTLWSTLAAAQAGQAGQPASSLSAARTSLSHGKPAAFPSHSAQRFTPCRETDARG